MRTWTERRWWWWWKEGMTLIDMATQRRWGSNGPLMALAVQAKCQEGHRVKKQAARPPPGAMATTGRHPQMDQVTPESGRLVSAFNSHHCTKNTENIPNYYAYLLVVFSIFLLVWFSTFCILAGGGRNRLSTLVGLII